MAKHAAATPFITLALEPDAARPLYRQLYDALRAAILDGQLVPGSQFPATRALATQLGVSRFTVLGAFAQLVAEGYIEGQVGSGTVVSRELPGVTPAVEGRATQAAMAPRPRLSRRGQVLAATRIPSAAEDGRPRAFRPGEPALDQFPAATWARIAARLYRRPPHELLGYGAVAGYQPLRAAIAAYLRVATVGRGTRRRPPCACPTSPTEQSASVLAAASKLWLAKGRASARMSTSAMGA